MRYDPNCLKCRYGVTHVHVQRPTKFTRRSPNLVSARSTTKRMWRREGKGSHEWRTGDAPLDRYRVQYLSEGLHNVRRPCWVLTLPGRHEPIDQEFKTSALAKRVAERHFADPKEVIR